jgi:hypothetical protein
LFLKTGCKTQAELARLFARVPQVLGLTLALLQLDFDLFVALRPELGLFLIG